METKNQPMLAKPFESTGGIIKSSWGILKAKPWQFAGFEVFPVIPLLMFGIVASLVFAFFMRGAVNGSLLSFFSNDQGNMLAEHVVSQLSSGQIISLSVLIGLGLLLTVLFTLWATTAKVVFLKELNTGISLSIALKKSLPLVVGFVWVNILRGLVTLVGYILFIIPGIYFTYKYFLSQYVYVFEWADGVRGRGALKRSAELTRGYWWGLLSRTVVFSLYIFLAQLVLRMITGFVSGAATLSDSQVAIVVVGVIVACVSLAVGIAFQALGGIFQFKLFEHVYYAKKDHSNACHPFALSKRIGFIVIAILMVIGFFVMSVILALQLADTGVQLKSNIPESSGTSQDYENSVKQGSEVAQ